MSKNKIAEHFKHQPTRGQQQLFGLLDTFLHSKEQRSVFILKGYAGTGKTSIMAALVKALPSYKLKPVLLAPTGRAAKVLQSYSGMPAFTIHKKIYRRKNMADSGAQFVRMDNKSHDTLFIVDEASMISGDPATGMNFNDSGLLYDLIRFVYGAGSNCRIIFIGDTAQLPPVGSKESPALNAKQLRDEHDLQVHEIELTEVMRQDERSGILENATQIRDKIAAPEFTLPQLVTRGYKDFYALGGDRLAEGIEYAYNKYGIDETLVICRSNKNANLFNRQIRARILYRDELVNSGDHLLIVKNNYFWLPEEQEGGFIANGDIAKVTRIRNEVERYGLKFADASLQLIDFPNEPVIQAKIILDTLNSDSPGLTAEDQNRLYEGMQEEYSGIRNKRERLEKIKQDPFFNALQVKFAYAVTCHKSQGGQWKAVFIDQGYLTEEMIDTEFLRWLYTAITRATQETFLVNFDKRFFQ